VLLAGIVRHLDRVGDVTKAAPVAIGASSATNVSGGGGSNPPNLSSATDVAACNPVTVTSWNHTVVCCSCASWVP
jgi:hypothetical protein